MNPRSPGRPKLATRAATALARAASRPTHATAVTVAVLVTAGLAACGASPGPARSSGGSGSGAGQSGAAEGQVINAKPIGATTVYDSVGHYQVGQRWFTFTEPPGQGTAALATGTRSLLTQVIYPVLTVPAGTFGDQSPTVAPGPRPLIMFAPGFQQCGDPYWQLLKSWASAGYVVAVVNFPYSDCKVAAATENDMVNQPADVSYAITSLLGLSASGIGPLAGLLDPARIAVTGQSDGGDTVAAIAANSCCADSRVKAAVVMSGSEWPPMPGSYFQASPAPILFTQGSADAINTPDLSATLYNQDPSPQRYYLNLIGADHTTPYWGTNPTERAVAQVTLDFFSRYLLGRTAADQAMLSDGTVTAVASLASGSQPAP